MAIIGKKNHMLSDVSWSYKLTGEVECTLAKNVFWTLISLTMTNVMKQYLSSPSLRAKSSQCIAIVLNAVQRWFLPESDHEKQGV